MNHRPFGHDPAQRGNPVPLPPIANDRIRPLARMGLALLGSMLATGLHAQSPAPPDTVVVAGVTKRAVGSVVSLQAGDTACHVVLKDDQGRTFQEMADFAVCERPKAVLGRRVALSYMQATVPADSCQGDPACRKTQKVVIVQALKVLDGAPATGGGPAAATAAAGQTSFCTPLETVVFACRTGAKMVSICQSKEAAPGRGYLQYRFGKPDSAEPLEMLLPEGHLPASAVASGQSVPFAGGGGSWLRLRKGPFAYVAYEGIGKWGPKGETREKAGLVVERSGKVVATLRCSGKATSLLGPDWYGQSGVRTSADEDFLFPD